MLLKRLLPATLAALASLPLGAATTDRQRDQHFDLAASLVNSGYWLVAERVIDEFGKAGYDDPNGYYAQGLRLHWSHNYGLMRANDRAAKAKTEADGLRKGLEGKALPDPVARLLDDSERIKQFLNVVRQEINPDSPPPLLKPNEQRVAFLQGLIQRLIESTNATTAKRLKAVEEYEPTVKKLYDDGIEDTNPKFNEVMREATSRRMAVVEPLYHCYRALRLVIQRGGDYGIGEEFAQKTCEAWLRGKFTAMSEHLLKWNWEYGDYNFVLKHQIQVLRTEIVRLNDKDKSAAQIKGHKYDEVTGEIQSLLNLSLDGNAETGEKPAPPAIKAFIQRHQLEVWSDLLNWNLLIGTDSALRQGSERFKELRDWLAERKWTTDHPDRYINMMVGHLWMLGAQIHHRINDTSTRDALLAELQVKKNFFQGNAKQWIGWFAGSSMGASSGSSWQQHPRVNDPESALTTARAFLGEAKATADPKIERTFLVNAASQLRGAILGLDERDPRYASLAPQVYHTYATTLYRLEWHYQAVIVALEGLARFHPEWWGPQAATNKQNPWFVRGKITDGGLMIQRLAKDALSLTYGLTSRTSVKNAFPEVNKQALDFLEKYDPSAAKDGVVVLSIINLINLGDYPNAIAEANKLFDELRAKLKTETNAEVKAKLTAQILDVLKLRAQAWHQMWEKQFEGKAAPEVLAKTSAGLDETLGIVGKYLGIFTDPAIDTLVKDLPEAARKDQAAVIKAKTSELRRFVALVDVSKLWKSGEYAKIAQVLGPAFWKNPPDDERTVKSCLTYLCGSVAKLARRDAETLGKALKKANEAKDLRTAQTQAVNDYMSTLLEVWPAQAQARRSFNQAVSRFPALESEAVVARRQLASSFNTVATVLEQLARVAKGLGDEKTAGMVRTWMAKPVEALKNELGAAAFVKAYDAAGDGFDDAELAKAAGDALKRLDADALSALDADHDGALSTAELGGAGAGSSLIALVTRVAKADYADLMLPLLGPEERPELNLNVAMTLWDIGRKKDAAVLFEYFKAASAKDQALAAFARDASPEVEKLKAVLPKHTKITPFIEGKGGIPDLLIDQPGFLDQYKDGQVKDEDLKEVKRDYHQARLACERLSAVLTEQKMQIGAQAHDQAQAALRELQDLIGKMVYQVMVDGYLLEAYFETDQMEKAVAIADSLITYDPRDATTMMVMVEATCRKIESASEEMRKNALALAIRIREDFRRNAKAMDKYWTAYVQAFELSVALGQIKEVEQALRFNNVQNINPVEDMMQLVADDFAEGRLLPGQGLYEKTTEGKTRRFVLSVQAMAVLRRYLKAYKLEGVGIQPPLAITEAEVADSDNPEVIKTVYRVVKTDAGAPPASKAPAAPASAPAAPAPATPGGK